jgi:hypothetical protein
MSTLKMRRRRQKRRRRRRRRRHRRYEQAPVTILRNVFSSSLTKKENKLECLSTERLSNFPKLFFLHNLQSFVIGKIICPLKAFAA